MDICMVIRTTGLAFDDRVRKECLSLVRLGQEPCILVLENANKRTSGYTEYGVPFDAHGLLSRRIFKSGEMIGMKLAELHLRFAAALLRNPPEVLWLHNVELAGLIPVAALLRRLGLCRRTIWDQHELPPAWMLESHFGSWLLKCLMERCDAVIVANEERRRYLIERLGVGIKDKLHVLENLADRVFSSLPRASLPGALEGWLAGEPFLLAQGGAAPNRRLEELVEAVMGVDSIRLVVAGPCLQGKFAALKAQWGNKLLKKVYFAGMVPQYDLAAFVDHAIASVILYDSSLANLRLCAPNRLYQALARGTPVLVGSNPPMARIVNENGSGVVITGDGEDVQELRSAIREVASSFRALAMQADWVRDRYTWEQQDETVLDILGKTEA